MNWNHTVDPSIHPDRLSVAIDDVYDPDCLKSINDFLSCPLAPIQIASFLIGLLKNSKTNTSLMVYKNEEFTNIFADLTSLKEDERKVDLYPFPLALTDEPWVYEYTAATEWMPYFMYTNTRALTTSMHQSPIRFLISPFRWDTWMAFISSILFVSVLSYFIPNRKSISAVLNRFSWLALFFLFTVYTSNLKALLAQPKPLDPFTSLLDLADQISKGRRRILLEEAHTRRWRILADRNLTKPPEFEILNRLIETRPNALLISGNQTDVCRLLDEESDLVFFAYEDLTRTLCGDLCLWQYQVTEYPVIMKAIPITNMSRISTKMDVFLLAAFSFKEVLLNRLYKPRCGPMSNTVVFIGMDSLYGPIMLWILGLFLAAITFCIEMIRLRLMRSMYTVKCTPRD